MKKDIVGSWTGSFIARNWKDKMGPYWEQRYTIIQQIQLELRERIDMFRTSKTTKKCSFSFIKYVTGFVFWGLTCVIAFLERSQGMGYSSDVFVCFLSMTIFHSYYPKKKDEFTY